MNVFAGIDGGQSSTVAIVGDETRVLGRGIGPPADLVGEERCSRRQQHALERALDDALANARLPMETRFASVVAGITGFDLEISRAPDLSSRADRVAIVHDTVVAHAGALGGEHGIVVIAGTGSVAIGSDAAYPEMLRAGGWGYFFGDEGGAIWIARRALRAAMTSEDEGEPSMLGDRAATFFGATSLRHIQHAFAHGDLTRTALAAFARETLVCARERDPQATAVRTEAARELAALCASIDRRLGSNQDRRVSYAGGLFADDAFAHEFSSEVARAMPQRATVRAPHDDAAFGALVLARRG